MTEVIPYKQGHLDFLEPLSCYEDDAQERIEAHCLNPNHTAFTFVADNQPIAVVGCILTEKKVLSVWAIAGKGIMKYPIFYHKALKSLIDGHAAGLGVERIQSIIDADNHTAFVQHHKLGFVVEAKMLKSGSRGQDQYLFRRLM